MNSGVIAGGAMLMLVSIFFTIFTLGFGIVCTGPLFLIGFIIFILGFVIPEEKKEVQHYNRTQPTPATPSRYCPSCGRSIPFNASVCPYCGLKFQDYITPSDKSIYCSRCGFENKPDSIFCTKCGNKL